MIESTKQQQAIAMLQTELKQLYRKCVDADQKLDKLRREGLAKFANLFGEDSPFSSDGRHFVDYLPELAADLEELPSAPNEQWPHRLKSLLEKIQAMHQLLEQFKQSLQQKKG